MSDNVVKMPQRRLGMPTGTDPARPPPSGATVGEWTIKMRMIFGGQLAFEFDLPEMSMDPKSAADLVKAFQAAVNKAVGG